MSQPPKKTEQVNTSPNKKDDKKDGKNKKDAPKEEELVRQLSF